MLVFNILIVILVIVIIGFWICPDKFVVMFNKRDKLEEKRHGIDLSGRKDFMKAKKKKIFYIDDERRVTQVYPLEKEAEVEELAKGISEYFNPQQINADWKTYEDLVQALKFKYRITKREDK